MNLKLDIETVTKILAVACWGFGAFNMSAPVAVANQAPAGWHAFLLGLALYAAGPVVAGWMKPKATV